MDVNEEIVKEWLHLCRKQFTIDNISFKVYGEKGGSNYSNIDLLAVDTEGHYYDYEIKWRSVYSIGATDKETLEGLCKQMTRSERQKKIKSIIKESPYRTVLITSKTFFGNKDAKREKHEAYFKAHGIDIIYFEQIISELIDSIDLNGRYDSMLLQIVRILKMFGHLKK